MQQTEEGDRDLIVRTSFFTDVGIFSSGNTPTWLTPTTMGMEFGTSTKEYPLLSPIYP